MGWILLLGLLLQPVMITPWTPVTVTLTANAGPVDVRYTATEAEIITVTARSLAEEPIDVTLELLAADTHLAFNDDHGAEQADLGPQDAALVDLALPAAGTYTLRVNSFSGAQSGDIEVSLDSRPQVEACALPSQSVDLPANQLFACWLDLKAGQVITLTARDTGGTLDPLLMLADAAGQLLARNDDHAAFDLSLNVLDAQIAAYTVPADCRCRVQVHDFTGAAGTLALRIEIES